MTLFELMEDKSFSKIDIDFPEIKKIIFTEEELFGESEKNINDLLKLPEFMIGELHTPNDKIKKNAVYTPQKIGGQKSFIAKKTKNNNVPGTNINLNKFNLKNINIYKSKSKGKYILPKTNLKSMNYGLIGSNNINLNNFKTEKGNKLQININTNYNTNENLLSSHKGIKSPLFIKKKVAKTYINLQKDIKNEDNIKNNNEE